jgi:hypothetical protein
MQKPLAAILALMIGLVISQNQCFAQRESGLVTRGLLLLKNGEVLRGKITQLPDKVVVETDQGSKIVLPPEKTEVVCRTLTEAYWERCARTKALDVDGQKDLFHWCLKHKLLDLAQNQFALLTESKISPSALVALDRQLNSAIALRTSKLNADRQKEVQQIAAAFQKKSPARKTVAVNSKTLAPIEPMETSNIGDSNLTTEPFSVALNDHAFGNVDTSIFQPLPTLVPMPIDLRSVAENKLVPIQTPNHRQPVNNDWTAGTADSMIAQVGFDEPVAEPIQAPADSKTAQVPIPKRDDATMSMSEIEQEVEHLPKPFVGFYRKRIEKIFANGCSAAKCHEPVANVMPLLRRSRAEAIPKSMSMRNLYQVSKQLDLNRPLESPLYLASTQPHAGNSKPLIEKSSKQDVMLIRWLELLGGDMTSKQVADETEKTAVPAPNVPSLVPLAELEASLLNSESPKHPNPLSPLTETESPIGSPIGSPIRSAIGDIPELGNEAPTFKPRDPFDPEIFNRKHHQR